MIPQRNKRAVRFPQLVQGCSFKGLIPQHFLKQAEQPSGDQESPRAESCRQWHLKLSAASWIGRDWPHSPEVAWRHQESPSSGQGRLKNTNSFWWQWGAIEDVLSEWMAEAEMHFKTVSLEAKLNLRVSNQPQFVWESCLVLAEQYCDRV